MNGLKKGLMSLTLLSAFVWTLAPISLESAIADNAAPATPAAKPAPAQPAPAKPAMKKAAAKKPAKKKVVKKHAHGLPKGVRLFVGSIANLDMNASPMTITAVKNAGKKNEFVFGGDLTSKTAIFKGKKKVGMSALKEGQKVVLHYHRTHETLIVTAIHIH